MPWVPMLQLFEIREKEWFLMANPLFYPDTSDMYSGFVTTQSKLTLMSESLRNDGRI